MRFVFVLGAVLVSVIGTDLLAFSNHTERFFAWTVLNPTTAVFLGSFYWTAALLAGLSAPYPL